MENAEKKCVECRYCELRVDPETGTRDYCTLKNCALSLDVCARMACDKLEPPPPAREWGF